MPERCTRIVHKALTVVRPQFRLRFSDGIHGLPHWCRVWFHGRALAAALDVEPAALAGNIQLALITTACGLAIAIPLIILGGAQGNQMKKNIVMTLAIKNPFRMNK